MGYRIEYDGGAATRTVKRKVTLQIKPLLLMVTALMVAVALFLQPTRLWVRNLLLPGDEAVTAAALGNLVDSLKTGESVGGAVEAFCREIISGD